MDIFVLGAKPEISVPATAGYLEKLKSTGSNTGNQLIAYSLLRQIEYGKLSWDLPREPAEIDAEFDMFLIPAANFIFPAFDFGGMASLIERTDLPVAIVGLGAQASNYDPDLKLLPGTERFLKVVSERSISIGVRGPFTAEVLARRGIRNVDVVGCPSYYMRNSSSLGLSKPDFSTVRRIATNGSRDVIRHAFDPDRMQKIVQGVYREAIRWNGDFIAQTEHAEIQLSEKTPEAEPAALTDLSTFLKGIVEPKAISAWATAHIRAFFVIPDWLQTIACADFAFGTRFHGNLIALQQGVPACFICHDTRTEEMCRFLGLPHVSILDIEDIDVAALYDRVDCERLNSRYAELYPAYIEFLVRNKLKINLA